MTAAPEDPVPSHVRPVQPPVYLPADDAADDAAADADAADGDETQAVEDVTGLRPPPRHYALACALAVTAGDLLTATHAAAGAPDAATEPAVALGAGTCRSAAAAVAALASRLLLAERDPDQAPVRSELHVTSLEAYPDMEARATARAITAVADELTAARRAVAGQPVFTPGVAPLLERLVAYVAALAAAVPPPPGPGDLL